MNYRSLIWILRFFALLTLCFILFFIFKKAPYKNQNPSELLIWNIIFLEGLLFFFFSSIFSLSLFWIRRIGIKRAKSEEMFVLGMISLRQGILLSFCVIILLTLQSFNILTWWDGLLAIGTILMIEMYFLVK